MKKITTLVGLTIFLVVLVISEHSENTGARADIIALLFSFLTVALMVLSNKASKNFRIDVAGAAALGASITATIATAYINPAYLFIFSVAATVSILIIFATAEIVFTGASKKYTVLSAMSYAGAALIVLL